MSENEKFWIAFGDIHQSASAASRIPDIEKAEALIITGDLTNLSPDGAVEKVWETVTSLNPKVYAQRGNMDRDNVADFLSARNANLHRSVYELAPGVKLMGVGYSVVTPFSTPGEASEELIAEWLDETYAQVGEYENLVLAVHDSPRDSNLDRINSGAHVGSQSIRKFIEKVQPDVVLCGHIHESAGTDIIGKSIVINPGVLSNGGYILIRYREGQLSAELKQV